MLIQCPQCETTFKLDEGLLGPEGAKVRCSRCARVFQVEPPEDHGPPAPSEAATPFTGPASDSPGPVLSESVEEEWVAALQKKSSRKIWSLMGLFILLVLLAVTVRYSYLQLQEPERDFREIIPQVFFLSADHRGSQKIRLLDVRGYYKNNPEGRFFVVEGKIRNGYGDWRRDIRLRGDLQDATRQVVASRQVVAGRTVSPEELESRPLTELTRLLESPSGPVPEPASLGPGSLAPFMILFPPTPQQLSEFSVEVVESKKGPAGVAAAR